MSDETRPASPDIDYSDVNDHQEVMKPVEQVKAGLQIIVDQARKHEAEILRLEGLLKDEKKKFKGIMEDTLPRALRESGFGDVGFPAADGTVITVKNKMEQSVLADRREEAWDWLERHDQSDIIKREVTLAFAVNEGDKAKELKARLEQEYMRSVDSRRWVEPATLKARLGDMMKAQADNPNAPVVDRELFGIREFDVAVFTTPKNKKK